MAELSDFSFDVNLNGAGKSEQKASGEQSRSSGPRAESGQDTGGDQQTRLRFTPDTIAEPAKKRRGRQPWPRDSEGNIIRPAVSEAGGTTQKKAGVVVGFKLNNRVQVFSNIHTMHAVVATLTKQPIFLLTPEEAKSMTEALCDVLDYHKVNITDGVGPWGLYIQLAAVVFATYKPRMDALKKARNAQHIEGDATVSATPGDHAFAGMGPMDFSADLDPSASMQ